MKKNNKVKSRYDYDPEVDYPKIKEENKRKLDEILSDPNYLVTLAKKYYGEGWLKAIPDDHYLKYEYKQQVNRGEIRAVNTKDETRKMYEDTPVIQTFNDGTEVEWSSVIDYCEQHGKKRTAAASILSICRGTNLKSNTLYKSKWRFKEEQKN
jgi:hypothetical protein